MICGSSTRFGRTRSWGNSAEGDGADQADPSQPPLTDHDTFRRKTAPVGCVGTYEVGDLHLPAERVVGAERTRTSDLTRVNADRLDCLISCSRSGAVQRLFWIDRPCALDRVVPPLRSRNAQRRASSAEFERLGLPLGDW